MDKAFINVWKIITILALIWGFLVYLFSTPYMILFALFWGWLCTHTAKRKRNIDKDFCFFYGATWGLIAWIYYLAKENK